MEEREVRKMRDWEEEIDLKDIFRFFIRFKVLILAIGIVLPTLIALYTFVSLSLTQRVSVAFPIQLTSRDFVDLSNSRRQADIDASNAGFFVDYGEIRSGCGAECWRRFELGLLSKLNAPARIQDLRAQLEAVLSTEGVTVDGPIEFEIGQKPGQIAQDESLEYRELRLSVLMKGVKPELHRLTRDALSRLVFEELERQFYEFFLVSEYGQRRIFQRELERRMSFWRSDLKHNREFLEFAQRTASQAEASELKGRMSEVRFTQLRTKMALETSTNRLAAIQFFQARLNEVILAKKYSEAELRAFLASVERSGAPDGHPGLADFKALLGYLASEWSVSFRGAEAVMATSAVTSEYWRRIPAIFVYCFSFAAGMVILINLSNVYRKSFYQLLARLRIVNSAGPR